MFQGPALASFGGEEGGDLVVVFQGENAAGGVDHFATWFDHLAVAGDDVGLFDNDAVEEILTELPLSVGVTAKYAEASAGNIEQQPVGTAGQPFGDLGGGDGPGLKVGDTVAAGTSFQFLELPIVDV